MKLAARNAAIVLAMICLSISGIAIGRSYANDTTHDPASLDRRISMIEQRFYYLESNMRRLEQQVVSRPSTSTEKTDDALVRTELDRLKGQLQVMSCAIVKLDERTLPANQKQSNRGD